jgi:hypothetical protein
MNEERYRIEVSRIEPLKEGDRYPNTTKLYEQTVPELDLPAVIAVVNGLSAQKSYIAGSV